MPHPGNSDAPDAKLAKRPSTAAFRTGCNLHGRHGLSAHLTGDYESHFRARDAQTKNCIGSLEASAPQTQRLDGINNVRVVARNV